MSLSGWRQHGCVRLAYCGTSSPLIKYAAKPRGSPGPKASRATHKSGSIQTNSGKSEEMLSHKQVKEARQLDANVTEAMSPPKRGEMIAVATKSHRSVCELARGHEYLLHA